MTTQTMAAVEAALGMIAVLGGCGPSTADVEEVKKEKASQPEQAPEGSQSPDAGQTGQQPDQGKAKPGEETEPDAPSGEAKPKQGEGLLDAFDVGAF